MVYRVPFLQILGPNGRDLVQYAGSTLVGVKLVDRGGGESDESFFNFTRKLPYPPTPAVGTPFTVRLGWSADAVAITGYYTFQRLHILGNPKEGQRLQWICRAAAMFDDSLKAVDSRHFDAQGGFKTMGDLFEGLFKGQSLVIPDEFKSLPIPGGYFLQWNQSAIDAATGLAEDNGYIIKPMGNKIVLMKRGDGKSGSGASLPTIEVQFDKNYDFDVEIEPRFTFSSVSASWWDADKGALQREDKAGGGASARDALPHPYPSQDAAQAAASAAASGWEAEGTQGLFTKPGDPAATSNCPVKCTGFGSPIDDVKWSAVSVDQDVVPNVGWTTTIETELALDAS